MIQRYSSVHLILSMFAIILWSQWEPQIVPILYNRGNFCTATRDMKIRHSVSKKFRKFWTKSLMYMQCIPLELHICTIRTSFDIWCIQIHLIFLSDVIHLITKTFTVMWFIRKNLERSQWIAEWLEDLSQSSAFRGMVPIVFLQQNSRSNFESSTQTSRQSCQGEKLSWTNSNFSATSDDGDTVATLYATFLRLLTNEFLSFCVGKANATIDQRLCLMDSELALFPFHEEPT